MPHDHDRDISKVRAHYRSGRDSLANDFFAPCLQACTSYRRAAGYFSSSALVTWVAALPRLAQSPDVSIKVIASPQLSAEDIETLRSVTTEDQRRHYEAMLAERILEDILRLAQSPTDRELRGRIFAWLIAHKRLSMRFAFASHVLDSGIFHEKIGIFDFPAGEQIAFTGSANETISGHERNYESIDVYRSWVDAERERVHTKIEQFDEAWDNNAFGLSVHEISDKMIDRFRAIAPEDIAFPLPLPGPPPEQPPEDTERRCWRHQDEAIDRKSTRLNSSHRT